MATFEGYERRIDKINKELANYGIKDINEAKSICESKGIDVFGIVRGIQPIAFENACWAYTVGAAIAIKKGVKTAAEAAEAIGVSAWYIRDEMAQGKLAYSCPRGRQMIPRWELVRYLESAMSSEAPAEEQPAAVAQAPALLLAAKQRTVMA